VNIRPFVRRSLLVVALLLLMALAFETLTGAIQQMSRARTFGQQAETAIQLLCSALSLLVVVTCFRVRQWTYAVRAAWAASLAATAGLSALAWGPPMLGVALLGAACTLLVALGLIWVLKTALAE
jgi:hypothetical protein